ncbi:MAG: TMEM143 family protein [Gemmataceae bacterium]
MAVDKQCPHFIPLLTEELLDLLCGDRGLPPADRAPLAELTRLIREVYHRQHHGRLMELKAAYAPFDPDRDTVSVLPLSAAERQRRLNDLLRDLRWVLERAHFRHLDRKDIEPSLETASDWGILMRVDFSAFEHVALFARGQAIQVRTLCNWKTLFQPREREVAVFRRLVLILKLRNNPRLGPAATTEHVYLKVFKDIPVADVDMLLPGARVRLKLLDRGKIGVGFLSGLGIMVARVFEKLNLVLQGIAWPDHNLLWGLAAGVAGYGYKSYFDYQNTRQAYHLNLTQSLYFQNLDSNAGVLTRLFDEAEEQETRTTLLGYFCLLRHGGEDGLSSDDLEAAMEMYLDRYAEVNLHCVRGDPVQKLLRLGLANRQDDRYHAVPLTTAVAVLRDRRDEPTTPAAPPWAQRARSS